MTFHKLLEFQRFLRMSKLIKSYLSPVLYDARGIRNKSMKFILLIFSAVVRVHMNQWLPLTIQKRMAERRVLKMVRFAYENVPYYRKKYDDAGVDMASLRSINDLKKLPFLTKEDVLNNFPRGIVARGYDVDKCHYSATTGSTGRSLPFIFSSPTFAFYIATVMRVYTMIGFRPWHKTVYIKYKPVEYPRIGPFFRTDCIASTIPVEEQIAKLREAKPDLLVGYASIVLEIAQKLTKEDLEIIRPKFVGLNSELSSQSQRDFISGVFNCPVYDEYSTEETWMVASHCKRHSYHIFIDNVWVEFLDETGNEALPGQIGEIVLTATRSFAMPFIRYRIGDLGRYSAGTCGCGIGLPVLESFEGRADDSFILPSGKFVSSLKVLNTFTTYIKKYLHLMEEFRVVQREKGLIVIELVRGKEYSEERFQELINRLHEIMGEPVTIRVDMVDAIDTGGSIKRKAIESLVSRNAALASMESRHAAAPVS